MVKIIVLVLAVVIPLLPLGVWASHAIEGFAQAGDRLAVYLYFPARAFALVGFVMMFYQFILSARISFLEHLFSRPKLVKNHRTLGKIGFILILLHGILMIATDFADFGALTFTWQKLVGMLALFLLMIGVIAAWFFKALDFSVKTWKKIHLLAYVAFPLAFLHAITIGITLRQSPAITMLYTILFGWYLAIVAIRLFGAGRGVFGPSPSGAQKPGPRPARPAANASKKPTSSTQRSEPARPAGASGSETERLGDDS